MAEAGRIRSIASASSGAAEEGPERPLLAGSAAQSATDSERRAPPIARNSPSGRTMGTHEAETGARSARPVSRVDVAMMKSEPGTEWRACVVGVDGSWRQIVTLLLTSFGWPVSAREDLPTHPEGFRILVLHRPSIRDPIEAVLRSLPADGRRLPLVFVFDDYPSSEQRAEWLEAGATDVFERSQSPRELRARLMRATMPLQASSGFFRVGPFRLDLNGRRAWVGTRELNLTQVEFGILALLANRANEVVSHEEIRKVVIGVRTRIETSRIRTHVSHLRSKLGRYGALLQAVVPRHYRLSTNSRLPEQTGNRATTPTKQKIESFQAESIASKLTKS